MNHNILILPGDGIGPEICEAVESILRSLNDWDVLSSSIEKADIGGIATDNHGSPLPESTLTLAQKADGVLLGAVGGPQYDTLPREKRPERGLLAIRKELQLFANLRPATVYSELRNASSLKAEVLEGVDLLVFRELTGGIYFGEPRGISSEAGEKVGRNTYIYSESEIKRIAHLAFQAAEKRNGKLCSVDKANVLEATELWRSVVNEVARDYAHVELQHMYVDNACMQLIRDPGQFDVVLTGNMFGDILSDAAAMITGSIGMLPSASLGDSGKGLYEPVHGSAPDIAGQNVANPLATILSLAMMLRFSLGRDDVADGVEKAVVQVLRKGLRTKDIATTSDRVIGTKEMTAAVVEELKTVFEGV